ncbi:hypothetical protein B9Z65_7689 [Elsinoe australis]|uniref:RING-type E3 ubiquitin transferase n=1 Tax=Elsinoe australis TaxID=40998 RepID=A0A2P8A087_9PEZI|nr:hypothetical protein B9Z65_7689 [Elsinoe australis]
MSLPPSEGLTEDNITTTTTPGPSKGKALAETIDHVPETCVICLSAISERAVTYPCNHLVFDFLCLVSWLQQRPNCPLCNTPVQRVEYDWRAPHDFKTYTVPTKTPTTTSSNTTQAARRGAYRGTRGRGSAFRRPQTPGPSIPSTSDLALQRRRLIYIRQLFSLHRAPARPIQSLTPALFRSSPHLQRKARLFLRRELQVFTFLKTTSRLEFVLEYIVGMLRKLEIKGADGGMENLVAEVLGRAGAKLLLHEIGAWLESSFDRLEDWDRAVQYRDGEVMRMGSGEVGRDGEGRQVGEGSGSGKERGR